MTAPSVLLGDMDVKHRDLPLCIFDVSEGCHRDNVESSRRRSIGTKVLN